MHTFTFAEDQERNQKERIEIISIQDVTGGTDQTSGGCSLC